jgi:hypothetical protein
MRGETFALTSLQDQSFRPTIAFFFTDELVLCTFDVFHALWTVFEPGRHYADVAAWCEATRARAESVVVIPDREIATVRITLRMMQDQLFIARKGDDVSAPAYRIFHRRAPTVHRFLVIERAATTAATQQLVRRFGARFELAETLAYTAVRRLAPRFAK